jgi:hypothetical protein
MSKDIRTHALEPSSYRMWLHRALEAAWISWNSPEVRNTISLDVDHAEAVELADRLVAMGLPRPLIVLDPWTLRAHVTLFLADPVCISPNGRRKPREFAEDCGHMLALFMRGTLLPAHALTKNPFGMLEHLKAPLMHREQPPVAPPVWEAYEEAATGLVWHTIPGDPRPVTLHEIAAALSEDHGLEVRRMRARERRWRKDARPRPDQTGLGRNCDTFNAVRLWAREHRVTERARIMDETLRFNAGFLDPMRPAECRSIAKSISGYMQNKRRRGGYRARQSRDAQAGWWLTPKQRQALAGQRSGAARRDATDAKIAGALVRLHKAGNPKPTQAQLAKAAHVSLRTVKRRWASFREGAKRFALRGSAPCLGARRFASGVKFTAFDGAEQGTAKFGPLPEPDKPPDAGPDPPPAADLTPPQEQPRADASPDPAALAALAAISAHRADAVAEHWRASRFKPVTSRESLTKRASIWEHYES